jgi:3,4-dihydroxy-2-butanone 4-phosphate synthase
MISLLSDTEVNDRLLAVLEDSISERGGNEEAAAKFCALPKVQRIEILTELMANLTGSLLGIMEMGLDYEELLIFYVEEREKEMSSGN